MVAASVVDLGNVVAEFAGVAASMEIFGVSKYISVPIAAIVVWVWCCAERTGRSKRYFWSRARFIVTYIVSAILAKPDWLVAAKKTVIPHAAFQCRLFADADRAGRHDHRAVAIFLFAGGLRRKARGPEAIQARAADVLVGSISCMVIVFFIIV